VSMQREGVVLIGKPVGPVALDVAAAFWQSTVTTRVSYAFFSLSTIVFLSLTAVGGWGVFDKT
jgi:hypothetical protein